MYNRVPSNGIPIVQGLLVGERSPEVDAVPLIDVNTATALGSTTAFTIAQRPSLTEACCPMLERSNIYDVYDGATGQHIFFAKEKSSCIWRTCCAPRHSLLVEFKLSTALPPPMLFNVDVDSLPTAMTMEREGCPSKPCLGCCVILPMCRDGMYMHAGPVNVENSLKAASPACVGFAAQPQCGGGLAPTLNVMERARGGGPGNTWNALAKVRLLSAVQHTDSRFARACTVRAACCAAHALNLPPTAAHAHDDPNRPTLAPCVHFVCDCQIEGPTCFGGCLELCCSSTFTVSSYGMGQLGQKVGTGDVATIIKQKPRSLMGALREAITDADVYTMQLNPAARLAPQQKATLLGALVLTDFMFFERDTPPCGNDGCNLCQMYCCGCLVPCSCVNPNRAPQQGGGGGGGFRADQ